MFLERISQAEVGGGGQYTLSAPVAMYGEEEDDFGAEVAEVADQAEQLCRISQSVTALHRQAVWRHSHSMRPS